MLGFVDPPLWICNTMTQASFDFIPQPNQEAKEIQKWVESHNKQIITQANTVNIPPGSLLGALNESETRSNAVYLLRGVLSQQLRKSMGSSSFVLKKTFLQSLKGEMVVKKTSQDIAQTVRNVLIKMQISR